MKTEVRLRGEDCVVYFRAVGGRIVGQPSIVQPDAAFDPDDLSDAEHDRVWDACHAELEAGRGDHERDIAKDMEVTR